MSKIKRYNYSEEFEELVEMSNLSSKRTGIKTGYIQIKSEMRHPIYPHIHFVKDLKKSKAEYIKFSIDSDINKIEIIEIKNLKLSKKEIEQVKEFISKNSELLNDYYLQGEFLDTDDFLDNIKKI